MKYKQATIEWFDASSKSEWQDANNAGELAHCFTTGWLVKETDQAVTICNSYTDDGMVGDCITIPRPWIEVSNA